MLHKMERLISMLFSRRTKIIASLGPSSENYDTMKKMVFHGIDVFRINLAHGSISEYKKRIKFARELSKEKFISIIADIRGSKLRVGKMPKNGAILEKGSIVTIDSKAKEYKSRTIPIPLKTKLKKGDVIFLDDGIIALEVRKHSPGKILCEVTREGRLFSKKGVNIPGYSRKSSPENDKKDVLLGKKLGVDYISLSYLKSSKDVERARKLLRGSNIKLIGKIESVDSISNIDEIIHSVDAVMIARGDLGLEIPFHEVPLRQKEIVEKCRRAGVPVIVATQMLASMTHTLMPTRAEVSDVANAVFNSADAVMLSGETTTGLYPVESVKAMREIVESSEGRSLRNVDLDEPKLPVNVAVAEAACKTAYTTGARCIIVSTSSGFSAKAIAKYRPLAPIVAVTESKNTAQQLSLVWGVTPLYLPKANTLEKSLEFAKKALRKKFLTKGDIIVYVSGIKFGEVGGTNMMKVLRV
jgi:pyruvate kinase